MQPTRFDLNKLSVALGEKARHRDLRVAIRHALNVTSANTDLSIAADAMRLLLKLSVAAAPKSDLSNSEISRVVESLFVAALINYARATDTSPISRDKWFGVNKLSAVHRALHRQVMHLRNKEVAHFGTGTPIDGEPLRKETIYLSPSASTLRIGYRSSMIAVMPRFALAFAALIDEVRDLAHSSGEDQFNRINEALDKALLADPSLWVLIESFAIDDTRLGPAPDHSNRMQDGKASTSAWTDVHEILINPKPAVAESPDI